MDLAENGKLLYGLRKAKGMTQKQVADRLGIQPKTVSKWERGRGFPDISTLSEATKKCRRGIFPTATTDSPLSSTSITRWQSSNRNRRHGIVCKRAVFIDKHAA